MLLRPARCRRATRGSGIGSSHMLVFSDGCRNLYDPAGSLGRLYEAVRSTLNPRTADAPVAVLQPVPVYDARGTICQEVLESVPEWFGIPASIDVYILAADRLPMLAYFEPAGAVVGFASVKTPHTGRNRGECYGRQTRLASSRHWECVIKRHTSPHPHLLAAIRRRCRSDGVAMTCRRWRRGRSPCWFRH